MSWTEAVPVTPPSSASAMLGGKKTGRQTETGIIPPESDSSLTERRLIDQSETTIRGVREEERERRRKKQDEERGRRGERLSGRVRVG